MTTITTAKDRNNAWTATNRVPMDDNRIMVIDTRKDSRGNLTTTATVVESKTEDGFIVDTFTPWEDYQHVMRQRATRCTEQAVIKQQAWALSQADSQIKHANQYYGARAFYGR